MAVSAEGLPGRARFPVVDVHTHVVPKGWPDLAAACGGSGWPWLRVDSERAAMFITPPPVRPISAS